MKKDGHKLEGGRRKVVSPLEEAVERGKVNVREEGHGEGRRPLHRLARGCQCETCPLGRPSAQGQTGPSTRNWKNQTTISGASADGGKSVCRERKFLQPQMLTWTLVLYFCESTALFPCCFIFTGRGVGFIRFRF